MSVRPLSHSVILLCSCALGATQLGCGQSDCASTATCAGGAAVDAGHDADASVPEDVTLAETVQPEAALVVDASVPDAQCPAVSCGAGLSCCAGACLDLLHDPQNCGTCGAACTVPGAVAGCVASSCVMTACAAGFLDCNHNPADGCEAVDPGAPTAPRLIAPTAGSNTGSYSLGSARQPHFSWSASTAGGCSVQYHFQLEKLDASSTSTEPECKRGALDACQFKSPAIDQMLADTKLIPKEPLVIRTAAPTGDTFVWRVQACDGALPSRCSAWSPVSYVNVGRVVEDLDGDGYAEIAASHLEGTVGSDDQPNGIYLYRGKSKMDFADRIDVKAFNCSSERMRIRFVGDVDGDGYNDLAYSCFINKDGRGKVGLLFGGLNLNKLRAPVVIDGTTNDGHFGIGLTGAFDYDADGFADLLVAAPGDFFKSAPDAEISLYRGGTTFSVAPAFRLDNPGPDKLANWGYALASVGDANGDGIDDVAIVHTAGRKAFLLFGARGPFPAKRGIDREVPVPAGLNAVSKLGDLDGDGLADLLFASNVVQTTGGQLDASGQVVVVLSKDGSTLSHSGMPDDYLGTDLAGGGDVEGDGAMDFLVGAPGKPDATKIGSAGALLFSGGKSWVNQPSTTYVSASPTPGEQSGYAVALADHDGDGYADIVVTIAKWAPPFDGSRYSYLAWYPGKNPGLLGAWTYDTTVAGTKDPAGTLGMALGH